MEKSRGYYPPKKPSLSFPKFCLYPVILSRTDLRLTKLLSIAAGSTSNHWSNAILLPDIGSNKATQVLYLFIILFTELGILLHDFMQSCLHSVLTAAKRITVTVQETVHISTFHHLHQDGCQLSFQGQQSLKQHKTRFQLCATQATNISGSFMASLHPA